MPDDALAQPAPAGARPRATARWSPRVVWMVIALATFNVLVLGALAIAHRKASPVNDRLAGTGLMPSFTLTDVDGRAVTQASFAGRFALVYFGYTYCPDICPTELGFEERVLKALGDDAGRITPVFISVDPERDSPRQLKSYASLFDPRMVALTGTQAQLRAAIAGFGGMFDRQAATAKDGSYLINHTSSIYLLGPEGEVLFLCDSHDGVDATAACVRIWMNRWHQVGTDHHPPAKP
jgi:protein SCO1/2